MPTWLTLTIAWWLLRLSISVVLSRASEIVGQSEHSSTD